MCITEEDIIAFREAWNRELKNPKPIIIPLQCFSKKQLEQIKYEMGWINNVSETGIDEDIYKQWYY